MKKQFIFYIFFIAVFAFYALNTFAQANSEKDENNYFSNIQTCVVLAESGDTIQSVAERYEISALAVAKLNGLFVTTRLPKGKEVKIFYKADQKPAGCIIPAKEKYEFVRAALGDTVQSLACRYNVSPDEVAEINKLSVNSRLTFAQKVKIPTEQNYECEATTN